MLQVKTANRKTGLFFLSFLHFIQMLERRRSQVIKVIGYINRMFEDTEYINSNILTQYVYYL